MWITYIGISLAIVAEGKYIHSVIKGTSKPNFSAWMIFTISMVLVLLSSHSLGARESLLVVGVFTILHFITALFAWKHRQYALTRFDKFAIVSVMCSVLLWSITNNAWFAFILNVGIDVLGYAALVYKLHLYPSTEDIGAWAISLLAYIFNLLSISTWNPEEYVFTISNIVFIALILLLSLRGQKIAYNPMYIWRK